MPVTSPSMPPLESVSPIPHCPLDGHELVLSPHNSVENDIEFLPVDPTLNLKALTIHKGNPPHHPVSLALA